MRWRDVKQHKTKQQKETIEESTPHLPYASMIEKIKAFITDAFLLSMPIFYLVIYFLFDGLRGEHGVESHRLMAWIYVLIPLGIVVVLFYIKTGQTPGMKAYEIKVIDTQTQQKPTLILAILRYFFFNLVLFSFVGLFFGFFRKDRRGVHDLLSGTSVIKIPHA